MVGWSARRWSRFMGTGLVAYLTSRLCVLAGASIRVAQLTYDAESTPRGAVASPSSLLRQVLTSFDGKWYLAIAETGYPVTVPEQATTAMPEARAAFFPLYPAAIRLSDAVMPGDRVAAALTLNFILGAVAVALVGALTLRVFDEQVAVRAMVFFALFPGSFVLSFAYAEALFIVLAASCLLLLVDERWLWAGIVGALASATRPNGLAVVAAVLVASVAAARARRDWRPLVAVALAPLGFVGFQVWLSVRTNEFFVWLRVQQEAWSEGVSFGLAALRDIGGLISSPLDSATDLLTAASLITLMVMAVAMRRYPLPPAWVAYCGTIVVLMVLPDTVTARPRFVFTSFPGFIAIAAMWQQHGLEGSRRVASELALVICGAGLAVATGLYAVGGATP